MSYFLTRHVTVIIAMLFAVTLLSWRLANGGGGVAWQASVLVILIAAFKIRFVILDFMEIRAAPTILRLFCEGWVAVLTIVLVYFVWPLASHG